MDSVRMYVGLRFIVPWQSDRLRTILALTAETVEISALEEIGEPACTVWLETLVRNHAIGHRGGWRTRHGKFLVAP